MEPDWGSGDGQSHLSDDGAGWGSHPLMSDPDWSSAPGLFVPALVIAALIPLYSFEGATGRFFRGRFF
jgi:hypothetical protein